MTSTLVVGTAGHIDHGKTTLLRALSGIDADRLPEERRRGMTIDVGFAHLTLEDGITVDFVDVPGHDRLVGNMLVGAGEIDLPMLVVAADDGPSAQTLEHLALLDALRLPPGLAVVTKVDAVAPERVEEVRAAVRRLLDGTGQAGAPVLTASGLTGAGLGDIRERLATLAAARRAPARPPTLAIDRVFGVKGRGVVVTGTLRGGPLATGDRLRLLPDAVDVRVRELQVHGGRVDRIESGGRTAINLAGVDETRIRRGDVLTADPTVASSDRVLVTLASPLPDRTRARFHAGTAAADATVGRAGRDALELPDGTPAGILRLAERLALRPEDRFVLRRTDGRPPVGGLVLDLRPPTGISRRRQTPERVAALADAVVRSRDAELAAVRAPDSGPPDTAPPSPPDEDARLALHGAVADGGGAPSVAQDVQTALAEAVLAPLGAETDVAAFRTAVARALRRLVTLPAGDASRTAAAVVDGWLAAGRLVRDGERIRPPGVTAPTVDPGVTLAMDRLEAALAVLAPPPLTATAREVGCPPDAVRALERAGRIVVLERDLAYAMSTYRDIAGTALRLAGRGPLTPAALRDATGTSRKYVMAILEDLDRRAILRRTPDGHVAGPKAPVGSTGTR